MALTQPPVLMIREYTTPEAWNATGNGATSDRASFVAMLASGVRNIVPDCTKVYAIDGPLIFPDDLTIEGDLSLRVISNAPNVVTPLITLGRRVVITGRLRIEVDPAVQWGRLLQGTNIESLRLGWLETTSPVQQNGYITPDTFNDGVFIIDGASRFVQIGYWRCANFDIIGRWRECDNVQLGELHWTSFRKGLEVSSRTNGGRGARQLHIESLYAVGNSPNSRSAIDAPGENALILQAIENGHIEKAVVRQTGSHGIRVTGDNNADQVTRSLTFGHLQIYRPGGCGLKLGRGTLSPQTWIEDVQIGSLYVEDAGDRLAGLTGAAYMANNNDFGLFLDQVRRCQVGTYFTRKAVNTHNGVHGLKLRSTTDFSMGRAVIRDAFHDAIRIEDLEDTPTQDGINFEAMCARFGQGGEGGAALNFSGILGTMLDLRARLHISGGVDGVRANGITGTVGRPVLITGHYAGLSGSPVVAAASPNVHIDLEAL